MEIIEILAGPKNLLELLKRVSPFRMPVFIWGQVGGDNSGPAYGNPVAGSIGYPSGGYEAGTEPFGNPPTEALEGTAWPNGVPPARYVVGSVFVPSGWVKKY